MKLSKRTKRSTSKPITPMEARGRRLAVDMIRELEKRWDYGPELEDVSDENLTEAMISQEPSVMLRYLDTVERSGSAELKRGFLCVLSDFLAGSMSSEISLDRYAKPATEARHG